MQDNNQRSNGASSDNLPVYKPIDAWTGLLSTDSSTRYISPVPTSILVLLRIIMIVPTADSLKGSMHQVLIVLALAVQYATHFSIQSYMKISCGSQRIYPDVGELFPSCITSEGCVSAV
jgi:hypothetical protein